MESFLTTIARLMADKNLPALMIGGHAVTALGHARATFDLMLVDDEIFKILEMSKSSSSPIATPGASAMIALKLHAIHQPSREDTAKDWSDVLALVKVHQLSLDDPEFAAIVFKHGGENAVQRIQAALAGGN